jgi:hypothetical protein
MFGIIINKDDGDKMLEDFLVDLTKSNDSRRCAQESLDILQNHFDRQLLLSVIVRKMLESQSEIPKHILDFEIGMLSALTAVFCTCEIEDIPKPLHKFLKDAKNDDEVFERVKDSEKLKYAVSSFIGAYMQFDYFESKYPEINKAL